MPSTLMLGVQLETTEMANALAAAADDWIEALVVSQVRRLVRPLILIRVGVAKIPS